MTISGRDVTSAGIFANVFQAIGSATFDGQSKVSIGLTFDTSQAVGTPVNWTGTYSIQANCYGVVTIATGGTATPP